MNPAIEHFAWHVCIRSISPSRAERRSVAIFFFFLVWGFLNCMRNMDEWDNSGIIPGQDWLQIRPQSGSFGEQCSFDSIVIKLTAHQLRLLMTSRNIHIAKRRPSYDSCERIRRKNMDFVLFNFMFSMTMEKIRVWCSALLLTHMVCLYLTPTCSHSVTLPFLATFGCCYTNRSFVLNVVYVPKRLLWLLKIKVAYLSCTLRRAAPLYSARTYVYVSVEIITLSYTYSFTGSAHKSRVPVFSAKYIHNGASPQIWLSHILSSRLCNGNKSFPGEREKNKIEWSKRIEFQWRIQANCNKNQLINPTQTLPLFNCEQRNRVTFICRKKKKI